MKKKNKKKRIIPDFLWQEEGEREREKEPFSSPLVLSLVKEKTKSGKIFFL